MPEHKDVILASGSRLRVTLKQRDGFYEVEIEGNRKGLKALAAICSGLSEVSDEDLQSGMNHYHLDEIFWGTEKGSTPLTIYCDEHGWTSNP